MKDKTKYNVLRIVLDVVNLKREKWLIMFKGVLLLLLFFFLVDCFAQEKTNTPERNINFVKSKIIGKDTVPHVRIPEIKIVPPYRFKNKRQRVKYSRFVINIKKTLPYARLANRRLIEIANVLDTIPTEKQKKQYLKEAEKKLFDEFEKPLKKLTFSQGRMLIKLIDRETGDTSYDLIKDLKGGFSAFMWQSVARLFGSNLKSEYDSTGDDAMIEHIVILIDNGIL